jgi:hypothetical protein
LRYCSSEIGPGVTEVAVADIGPSSWSLKKFRDLEISNFCASHANANMELLPAHQPLLEDDTDEELSDQQIKEMLNEAAERMRAKAALQPVAAPEAPFKLPKLRPGHIADTYEKTEGNITRLDHSKLIDKKQLALANGIKKIDDPIADKRKRKEVRYNHSPVPRR